MKSRLKLGKLESSLPKETIEALQSGGFFDASAEVKRTSIVAKAERFEPDERAVVGYISTRDVDRDGEVLVPQGAILDHYMLNPVVLWSHDYSGLPIGKAEWVKADKNGLKAKRTYANTMQAHEVWSLIEGGFLQTASVGFIPVERTTKRDPGWKDLVKKYNAKWGVDLEKDGAEIITTKWILLEFSEVAVPANPHALITAVAKGLALSDDMREQLEIPDPADTTKTEEEGNPATGESTSQLLHVVTTEQAGLFTRFVKGPDGEDHGDLGIIRTAFDQIRGKV